MSHQSVVFVALGLASVVTSAFAQTTGDADLLQRVAAAPVTDAMLRDPDPADWLMYSRTYDAQRFSPLDEIDRDNVGSLAARVVEAAAGRRARDHSARASRRHVSDDAGQPRWRQPRHRAERRDRRDVVGVRAAEHRVVAHQSARDLRRHDLLHGARAERRAEPRHRARRRDGRGALANTGHRRDAHRRRASSSKAK